MDFLMKMQATINMEQGVIRMLKGKKKIRNPQGGGSNSEGGRRQGWTRRKQDWRYESPGPEDWDKEVNSPQNTYRFLANHPEEEQSSGKVGSN
jgi:hypothetical protein